MSYARPSSGMGGSGGTTGGQTIVDANGNVIGVQGAQATHAYLSNGTVQRSDTPITMAPTIGGTYVYDTATGKYLGGTGSGSPDLVQASGGPPSVGAGSFDSGRSTPDSGGSVVHSQVLGQYWYVFVIVGLVVAGAVLLIRKKA